MRKFNMKKTKIQQVIEKVSPYRDIILFVVCLFAADAIWKLCVAGEEHIMDVRLFGRYDITPLFAALAEHIAWVVACMASWVRDTVTYYPPVSIGFDSGFMVHVVWGCTPVKQSFIWLVIILFSRGKWQHKLWYIPLGWLCAYVFNIIRIWAIALLCEHHAEMFPFWHEYVFKYLFYGMLFALWVIWVERINPERK